MDIKMLGNTKTPSVIVIGVFHGDEPQGEFLIQKYCHQAPKTNLLMVPCLNQYGFKHNVRTNINGVDLNRNFPTKNWEKTEKNEFYGGEKAASEPETQFIINIVEKFKPKVILTLHAPYKIVNYDGANSESDKKIIEKISKIMDYPIEPSIGYPTPGSFGTWAGVERKILTITLELDETKKTEEMEKSVFEVFKYLEGI